VSLTARRQDPDAMIECWLHQLAHSQGPVDVLSALLRALWFPAALLPCSTDSQGPYLSIIWLLMQRAAVVPAFYKDTFRSAAFPS
jgi:hypothetical protein